MQEDQARQIIEERVANGGRVVSAMTAELPSLKTVQDKCLSQGIPALLGPCSGGG
ncbi:MAG: hypothetical protein GY847_24760 [Proteobacteria bacterium]|nr:hypothetical protein [Pseudomonadota bacterium]